MTISKTHEGVTYSEGDLVEFMFDFGLGSEQVRGPLEVRSGYGTQEYLVVKREQEGRELWTRQAFDADHIVVLHGQGYLGGRVTGLRKVEDIQPGDKVRLVKRWAIQGMNSETWDSHGRVGDVLEVVEQTYPDRRTYSLRTVHDGDRIIDRDCVEKVTGQEATSRGADDVDAMSVEELREKVRGFEQRLRTIGNDAIELAEREGYCPAVERFLDDHDIPYGNEEVEVVVMVEHRIKGQLASRRDMESLADRGNYLAQALSGHPLVGQSSDIRRIVDVEVNL